MNLFSQKPKSFGLDISDLSLKVANVEKKGRSFELVSFGSEVISKGIIKDGEIQDETALVKVVRKVLGNVKGKKIKTRDVICCLPEEKSFLDTLQVPILAEDETSQAVKFEAANHIPVPLEEVYFDFEINRPLGRKNNQAVPKTSKQKQQDILIAATPKKIVDSYSSVLKKAGLIAQVMEIEPLAIVRALIKMERAVSPLLVIDFGACRTSFIIFSGYNVSFTSTIPISSSELTQVIAKNLNITPKKAEKMKQEHGLEGGKAIFDAMVPVLTDLTRKIKSHLDYYKSHIPRAQLDAGFSSKMDRILLCGGGANLKGLPNFLTSTFRLKVELADPWANIAKPDLKIFPELSLKQSLGYATAFGLALRGIR